MQLIACQKEDKVIWTQIFSGKQEYRYKYIFLKFLHDNNIYSMLFILLYRGRNTIQNKYMKKQDGKLREKKRKNYANFRNPPCKNSEGLAVVVRNKKIIIIWVKYTALLFCFYIWQ